MKAKDIEIFEKVYGQLQAARTEVAALSKKSPDGAINKFKLEFINQMLCESNKLLKESNKPLDGFEKFDPDVIPTNSDVVFVISQYIESLDRLKADNTEDMMFGNRRWLVDEEET